MTTNNNNENMLNPDSIKQNLQLLDGTPASSVSVLTGMSREELDELGGFES